ncbi:MAG: MFS family permease, partial [Myxococcota bacterium]
MFEKRFAPFFWTQFLGAFTDNAFKQALVLMITFRVTMTEAETGMLIAVASGLFILPYFLFSPLAGQIADKAEKAGIMRRVKLLEIVIMALAAAGFMMADAGVAWADNYLIAILFLMGTQSTFFGPAKYSIIPQHLRDEELMQGTALVESGTFIAILTGTIVGGILILQTPQLVGASLISLAVAGWLTSLKIPYAAPSNPELTIRWNWLSEYGNLYRVASQKSSVFLSIIGISWFWFLGAMVMAQLPNFVKLFVHGDESVYIFLLSLFTLSIAAGSTLTDLLSDDSIELGMVPFGAVGLTVFSLDIGLLDYSNAPAEALNIATIFSGTTDTSIIRVVVDICGMGVAGSFFIVPLYALLQHRTAPETRSQVIAANNVAGAAFMVTSAVVVSALYAAGFSTPQLFLVLAALNAVTGSYLVFKHPEFVLRFCSWAIGMTRYRVHYEGRAGIPNNGACLVLATPTGLHDWPMISAACERSVRFAFETSAPNGLKTQILRRWFRAIPVRSEQQDAPSAGDTIHAAFEAGEVVCLFVADSAKASAARQELVSQIGREADRMAVPTVTIAIKRDRAPDPLPVQPTPIPSSRRQHFTVVVES